MGSLKPMARSVPVPPLSQAPAGSPSLLGAASPAWSMRFAHTRHGMTQQVRLTFRVRPAVPARPGPGFGERPRCSGPIKNLDGLFEVCLNFV